jgi:NAD(P)-dependent dehydrogenase (short-subunit alcohol dehydrogenase family)
MKKINNLLSLENRTALFTGGGGNLGQMMAHALADLGANLILLDHPEVDCTDQAKLIEEEYKVQARYFACNLESKGERQDLFSRISQLYPKIEILINNAAFVGNSDLPGWATTIENQDIDTFSRALEVNLVAPFHLVQCLLPSIKNAKNASIINIGSIYGELGPDWSMYENTNMGNPAAYGASKAGLALLTKWFSTSLAPNIRVNMISPGGILRGQSKVFVDKYVAKTPMKRMAENYDFAGAICYFASDLSLYCTGQILTVDGGLSAW